MKRRPYNTFFEVIGKGNRASVILGNDIKGDKFYADVLFDFWGESPLRIVDKGIKGIATLKDNRVTLDVENKTISWYKSDDLLKWHITFKKAPKDNRYQLNLTNWQAFDFLYQSPLQGELEQFVGGDGAIWIRPQGADEKIGGYSQRPLSVDGSYAVYHKTKMNGRYATGKVLHIHRPFATDAAGHTAWLNLQIIDGVYTALLPDDFAEQAVYPVQINDTFGYTIIGGTEYITSAYLGYGVYSGVDGTGVSVHCACRSSSAKKITLGLYAANVDDDPDSLVGTCNDITCPANNPIVAFTPSNFQSGPELSSGTSYFIAASCEATLAVSYDTDEAYQLDSKGTHYVPNTLDDPFGTSSETGPQRGSLYVTYEEGGEGQPISRRRGGIPGMQLTGRRSW